MYINAEDAKNNMDLDLHQQIADVGVGIERALNAVQELLEQFVEEKGKEKA